MSVSKARLRRRKATPVRAAWAIAITLLVLASLVFGEAGPALGWPSSASARVTAVVGSFGPVIPPLCEGPEFRGARIVVGSEGPDAIDLAGSPGQTTIVLALGGNDRIKGGAGRNCIVGGGGDDQIEGGPVDDILLGGDGNDRIVGKGGHDLIDGGAGADRCQSNSGSTIVNCEKGGKGDLGAVPVEEGVNSRDAP